jgi:hypothetical protein
MKYEIVFSRQRFADLASVGNFATGDFGRPLLTGVFVRQNERGEITATATDSYKLAVITREAEELTGEFAPVIIPADVLIRAAKAFKKAFKVTVSVEGDNVKISAPQFDDVYGCRVIDGNYPDVDSLIPERMGINPPAENGDGRYLPQVAFNPYLLADTCKIAPWCNVSAKKYGNVAMIVTALVDNNRPIRVDGNDENGTTIALFMPVRTN